MSDRTACRYCGTAFTYKESCGYSCETIYCSNISCEKEYYIYDNDLMMTGHDPDCDRTDDDDDPESSDTTNSNHVEIIDSADNSVSDYFNSGSDVYSDENDDTTSSESE